MPFQIIRNDITRVEADAIVNTANPKPVIGGGTDNAVYKAAGEKELLEARKKIGDILPGDAVYTPAFHLKAKFIIHTVGPAWIDGNHNERETLHACYKHSLQLADKLLCSSIAFPLLATGAYGFPKDEALQIALSEISSFLMTHDMKVILVVFDKKSFQLSSKLVSGIDEYISEHASRELLAKEYDEAHRRRRNMPPEEYGAGRSAMAAGMTSRINGLPTAAGKAETDLDHIAGIPGKTFQQRLFDLIDQSGKTDVQIYKKAGIDRKLFSKIRKDENYIPMKKNVIALGIALQLDMTSMNDLLARAGYAFSPSSKSDLIIEYFVKNHDYDTYKIDAALFKYKLPSMFSNQ